MVPDRPIVSIEVERELAYRGEFSVTTDLFVIPLASERLADRPGAIGTPYCIRCAKITKIDSTEVSRFRRQSAGKIRIAEIGVRGTTFDSPYLGRQWRYSRNFTEFDSPPKCLQSDQKSLV